MIPIAWVAAAAVVALAAAAVLVALPAGPPALTEYDATLIGGISEVRGDATSPEGASRFGAGSRLELRLRPAVRVEGDVELRAFVEDAAGELHAWPVTVERSDGGAMRIRGTADELFDLPAGAYVLVVALARPGSIGSASASPAVQIEAAGRADHGRVLRVPIVLEEATQ